MKNFKKVLALVLAVVMLVSFATVASAKTVGSDFYTDKADINYKEAVDVLGAIGILNGYPDNSFRPEKNISRAEAAKIIAMFDNHATDISDIYASANPFADCVGNWAESFIAYGVKTGILAGKGGNKFCPNDNVTGVEFLKMALVVLGYDAKAEGMEGKNWDVNTLALAKRVGLTDTLGAGFEYADPLTREGAAVIMLDALKAETVEYGNALNVNFKNFYDANGNFVGYKQNGTWYVTVAGACKTGKKLMEGWKLAEGYQEDVWMRPYRTWTLNGDVIAKYMYTPAATFTTKYNMCQLLEAIGIAKSDSKAITLGQAENNTWVKAGHFINGAAANVENFANGAYAHDFITSTKVDCNCKEHVSGGQGTLTQVFKLNDGTYRITEIDTFLAEVKSVSKKNTNLDDHLIASNNTVIELYTLTGHNGRGINSGVTRAYANTTEFKVGDIVLVSVASTEGQWDAANGAAMYPAHDLVVAKTANGKFDGFKAAPKYEPATRIDGNYSMDSLHFHLGWSKNVADYGDKTFYFDRYENVIGMVNPSAAAGKTVTVNKMWADHIDGDPVMYADIVDMDGNWSKKVTVVGICEDGTTVKNPEEVVASNHVINDGWFDSLFAYAFSNWYHHLATAYVDGENYTLYLNTANRFEPATLTLKKGTATMVINNVNVPMTDNTKFLVHNPTTNEYEAVTGFRAIDTIVSAAAAQVIYDGKYATEVYLCGVRKIGDTFSAFVTENSAVRNEIYNGKAYQVIEVYVDGTLTTLYVDQEDFDVITAAPGFYKFQYENVGAENIVTLIGADDSIKLYAVTGKNAGVLELNNNDVIAVAADVKLYYVNPFTLELVKAEYDPEVVVGYDAYVTFNGNGEIAELYVLYNFLTPAP